MNCKFTLKRIFALILSTVLILNCVGFQTFATDSQIIYIDETFSNLEEPLRFSDFETSGETFSVFGLMPEVSEEREVEWIDRIHNKPDYAVKFYNWLVSNELATGALVTGHDEYIYDKDGTMHDVHLVTTYTEEVPFSFDIVTSDEITKAAHLAVDDTVEDNFYTAAEWISEVYAAFDRDHPEVFWLSGGTTVAHKTKYQIQAYTDGTGFVTYTQSIYFYLWDEDFDIRSSAFLTQNDIVAAIKERDAAVNNILKANTGVTDVEKIEFINKYLTENNYYNSYSNTNKYSPIAHRCISALEGKTDIYAPVCEGYAKAFKVLCDKMNIPCVLVDGECEGIPHMWNYVLVNGEWFAVDVTRNDPFISKSIKKSGYESADYLLIGSECVIDGKKFSETHIVHNTVMDYGISFLNEPLISKSAYKARVKHICKLKNGYCSTCYSKRYDVNRDTEIDMTDMIYLRNILLNDSSDGNPDCDTNGAINSLDFVSIKKYFWDSF